MTSRGIKRDGLITQIKTAFEAVEFPGSEHLTDSFGDEPEALVKEFRDKHCWQELSADFLNQAPDGWGSALSFFSGPALRFYLPAYLIADLDASLMIGDATSRLCAFVTPMAEGKKLAKFYGGGTMGEHARADFELFDAAQVDAIVDYLWWKLEQADYDPMVEQALEHYWLPRQVALTANAADKK